MPVIRYNEQQVGAQGIPNAYQNANVPAEAFGGSVAEGVTGLSNVTFDVATKGIEVVQQAEADDFINQYQSLVNDSLYAPETGYLNKRGQAAVREREGFVKNLETQRQLMRDQLPSEYAKQLFDAQSIAVLGKTKEVATRHLSSEFGAWQQSLTTGRIDNALNTIAKNWNDEQTLQQQSLIARQAVIDEGMRQGHAEEQINADLTKLDSRILTGRYTAALNSNDPRSIVIAHNSFEQDRAKGKLTFEHTEHLDGAFKVALPEAVAEDAFRNTMPRTGVSAGLGGLETLDDANIMQGLWGQESGNRQFDETGQVITSVKGALGVGQIMPETGPEAAAIAGVPWSLERLKTDEAYNRQLSTAYFAHVRQMFGSNTLALMAYNGGMGSVSDHIKKVGDPTKGEISLDQFVATFPKRETREYVASIASKSGGKGGMSAPTPPQMMEMAAALDTKYPGAGERFLKKHQSHQEALEKQQDDYGKELADQAYQKMYATNRPAAEALSPTEIADLARSAPDKFDKIMGWSGRTNPKQEVYLNSLLPAEFVQVDLEGIRHELSVGDYTKYKKQQDEWKRSPEKLGFADINKKVVSQSFKAAGIDEDSEMYLTAHKSIEAYQMMFEAQHRRAMNPEELETIVPKLLYDEVLAASQKAPKRTLNLVTAAATFGLSDEADTEKFVENPGQFFADVAGEVGIKTSEITPVIKAMAAAGQPITKDSVRRVLEPMRLGQRVGKVLTDRLIQDEAVAAQQTATPAQKKAYALFEQGQMRQQQMQSQKELAKKADRATEKARGQQLLEDLNKRPTRSLNQGDMLDEF